MARALERFDPDRGSTFAGYASRSVVGEMKHFRRDHSWSVRPPRALQELQSNLTEAVEQLTHVLGRAPTAAEISRELGLGERDVAAALHARRARRAESIEAAFELGESLGAALLDQDDDVGRVIDREALAHSLAHLPARDRRVLKLRFDERLSQDEIARRVGISQTQVSRLIERGLTRLRHHLRDMDR